MNDLIKREKEISEFISATSMPESVQEILSNELSSVQHQIERHKEFERREKEKAEMEATETPENLTQFLANATATYYGAGGHGKSERNRQSAEYWKGVMRKRNIPIPSNEELLKIGVFNGKGSQ